VYRFSPGIDALQPSLAVRFHRASPEQFFDVTNQNRKLYRGKLPEPCEIPAEAISRMATKEVMRAFKDNGVCGNTDRRATISKRRPLPSGILLPRFLPYHCATA
jgi:hypothetical protein